MKLAVVLVSTLAATQALADTIVVQSTTSTKNSGLYDYLLPVLK